MRRLSEKQQLSRLAILKLVHAEGGQTRWSILHSQRHAMASVDACVRQGDLRETRPFHYEITPAGLTAIQETGHDR